MAKNLIEYRWRNDDGTQATATWMAAENTPVDIVADSIKRLRINTTDTVGGDSWSNALTPLQYRLNGGAWTAVTTGSSVVRLVASGLAADNTATTEQMAGPNPFFAGRVDSNNTWTITNLLESPQDTEIEFVLKFLSADLADNDLLEFRLDNVGEIVTPTATIDKSISPFDFAGQTGYAHHFDTSVTSTISISASVMSFTEISGAGASVFQSNSGTHPQTGVRSQNGLNVLDFQNHLDFLFTTAGADTFDPMTIFLVGRFDVLSQSQYMLDSLASSTRRHGLVLNDAGVAYEFRPFGGSFGEGETQDTDLHVWAMFFDDSPDVCVYRQDANANITSDAGNNTRLQLGTLGANFNDGEIMDGAVCELIILDGDHTAIYDDAIQWLYYKWTGIDLNPAATGNPWYYRHGDWV